MYFIFLLTLKINQIKKGLAYFSDWKTRMEKASAYNNELKSVTKNAGITAIGLVVLNVMSFVNNAIITRTLGADQYGLYVLATRILEFIIVAASLGLSNSLIRFVSMYSGKKNQSMIKGTIVYVLKLSLIASIVFFVITTVLSGYIAEVIFERPDLKLYLRLILIVLPFIVFFNIILNTFIGLKLIKFQVLFANILSPLLFFVLISIVFLAGFGLNGLVAMHISNIAILSAAAWIVMKKKYFKKVENVIPNVEVKKIWNYNVPVYAAYFANTAFRLSPIFILGYFLDNTEIAVFNVSYKVGALVLFSMSAFRIIFMPTISELFAKKDKETISGLFKTITKWIFTFSLIVFSLVTIFNEPILNIFGNEFTTGALVLIIIMAGELVNASTGLVGAIILMSGRSGVVLINSVIQFLLIAGLAWWLTPIYGAVGTAFSYAVSLIIMNISRIIELYCFEKIHPYKFSTLKPLLASVIAFLSVYYLRNALNFNDYIEMIAGSLLFIGLFGVSTFLLKLDKDDKYILGSILTHLKHRRKFD